MPVVSDTGRNYGLFDWGFAFAIFPSFFKNRSISVSHLRRLATDSKSSPGSGRFCCFLTLERLAIQSLR